MPTLLTHTDLDGLGCAVLYAAAGPDGAVVELVENGSIDARVAAAIDRGERQVVVADHGVSPATAERIDAFVASGGEFRLLDHHRSSAHLGGRAWATVDEGRSGTGLLFDHLGRPAALADFAATVEDHDLWRHADPRSQRLAALAGVLGHDRFRARFGADPSVDLREGEVLLLEVEARRRDEYLDKRVGQARVVEAGGLRWAVVYADQYQSDLAERLMNDLGVAATAIVNPNRRTVSLRGRDFDVSSLAERFGGGGHARAAAFTFAGTGLEQRLAAFEEELDLVLLTR